MDTNKAVQPFKKMKTEIIFGILFIGTVLLSQLNSPLFSLIFAPTLILLSFLNKKYKAFLLLCAFVVLGHVCWSYLSAPLEQIIIANALPHELETVINRLGLIGYMALFLAWRLIQKPKTDSLHKGDFRAEIFFPFIWKGRRETTKSFLIIFCIICLVPALILFFVNRPGLALIGYGLLFAAVNSILEETIWRGLILSRMTDIFSLQGALIISAIAFGVYHLSLGFPLWTCAVFAFGGIYMGGIALTSKGILASTVMHFAVNILFVMAGIIF